MNITPHHDSLQAAALAACLITLGHGWAFGAGGRALQGKQMQVLASGESSYATGQVYAAVGGHGGP